MYMYSMDHQEQNMNEIDESMVIRHRDKWLNCYNSRDNEIV